jgi:hypothetical protein
MRNQFHVRVAALAAFALLSTAHPGAAQASFDACHFDATGGGCTHFQGYVHVRPNAANAPAFVSEGKALAETGRLYIHVEGEEAR